MHQTLSARLRTAGLWLGLTAVASFAFIAAPVVYAQESASVSGTVTDPTGALIPGAAVTLSSSDTGVSRKAATNSSGIYTFPNLLPGAYTVSASAPGFTTFSGKITVTVGASITLNAPLTAGGTSTTIEVSASQASEVNVSSPEISQVITPEQVSQLPSLTRNPYDFIALTGNVSNGDNSQNGQAQNGANRGVNFSLNGQRNSGTEILLDGVENQQIFGDQLAVRVPVDDVLEYRVITNNFAPQYGRASGGVVSVATKSGTNALHGTLWEFNRVSATTANTVANAQAGVAKGVYTRNMFGAAVGGPIIKDKLFFFASSEFLRVRSSANQLAAIPTPQLLAASAANVRSFYSTYAGPVAGTTVSTTTNLAAGGGATPLFPTLAPGTPVFNNISYTAPNDAGGGIPQNRYNITGRVDYNLGEKTQMFFRYVDDHEVDQLGSIVASPFSQYNVGGSTVGQAYLFSFAHEFNSAFSTIGKLSFTRVNISNSYNTALQNVPTLNLSGSPVDPATLNPFYLPGFYDLTPANGGLPYGGPQNTIQYNQDLAYTKSRHQIQVGGQVLYIQENQGYGAYAQASEQLGKSQAQGYGNLISGNLYRFQVAVNPKGATPCTQAQVTAATTPALVPAYCAIQLPASAPSFERSYRFHDWAGYAQDQFKATNTLTLSYGVRYEYYGIQHNNNPNLDSNFYYGTGSNLFAQVRNGSVLTTPNSPIGKFWNPQYGTVSPRVGFAVDLFGNGLTSLRGGYGISYERNFGNVTFNAIQNPPNYAVISTLYSAATPITVTNSNLGPVAAASGTVALPPTSLRHIDQNIRTAQTQFWSAAIDQKVGRNSLVEIAYNGSRGIHLYDIKNYNIPGEGNLYLGDSFATQGLTYPNAHFTNDNNRGSNGDSYYQAVNVQFNTQDIHHTGLSIIANYTFSHALDDLSSTFSETSVTNFELGYTNATNPGLDHGNSDFDLRHRFVVAPVYRTPAFFKAKGGALAQLLGGYEVTGIYTVRTGTPFSLYDSTNNNSGYQVPRYTPSAPITNFHFKKIPGASSQTSPDAYTLASLPADVPFGNAALGGISDLGPYPANMTARNPFYGPGAYNLDVSFSKTFPIYERVNLELRAEGFNVTNHHNLYIVESQDDAANYAGAPFLIVGRKGGAGYVPANDERRFLQFAGKINF